MKRGSGIRPWVIAFAPVVVLLAALVVVAALVDGALRPVPVSPNWPLAENDASTAEPSPTPSFDIEPFLVQVQPIEDAPLREGVTLDRMVGGQDTLVDSTYLGTNAEWFAVGWLSVEGEVCMLVGPVDQTDQSAPLTGVCSDFPAFLEHGLTYDAGYWDVTWLPTGQVVWQGLDG